MKNHWEKEEDEKSQNGIDISWLREDMFDAINGTLLVSKVDGKTYTIENEEFIDETTYYEGSQLERSHRGEIR